MPLPASWRARRPAASPRARSASASTPPARASAQRFAGSAGVHCNAADGAREIAEVLPRSTDDAQELLENARWTELGFSARAYDRILKVARTIADLAGSDDDPAPTHISEAINYRTLDRQS